MWLSGTSNEKIIIAATLPATLSHWHLVTPSGSRTSGGKASSVGGARRPRSYVVDMESGIQTERNKKMLVKQTRSTVPDSYDESYEFSS
ncbi:hypothetical protein MTO96_027619 [Rhipicephalus appendiculatus]